MMLPCAIAKAVGADKLVFLTDIEGLYKDINDKILFYFPADCRTGGGINQRGIIGGGMLPKLNNCTSAIRNGVNRVHILDGRVPHCLLLEIFTNEGVGTAIISDDEGSVGSGKKERNGMSEKALSMKEYIDGAEAALLHTTTGIRWFWIRATAFYLYDMEGKKYLDFCAGIAVFALGL